MKILRLRIQNLNSLKGVQSTLDFSKYPFRGTGLFAITGDTGAGKTTILDAMTLALYGRTPRDHESEVMTYNSTESMSELEFEAQGRQYRAKWSRSVNRNGNWREPRYELIELPSEKPLVRSLKTHVLPKIQELTGLTYEQFLRSVMLAQGDFAAFLNANKDDRSALLEKITGTEEYSRISKAAFDRFRIEKDKLTLLQSQSDYFNLLSEEEEVELQTNLKAYQSQYQDVQKQTQTLQSQIQWIKNIEQLKKDQEKLQAALVNIEKEQEKLAPELAELDWHKKAAQFEQDFILQKRLVRELDNDVKKITKLEEVLATLREELIIATVKEQEAKTDFEKLAHQKEEKEALFDQVRALDLKIENIKSPISEKEKSIKKLKKEIAIYEKEVEKITAAIAENQAALERVTAWLSENTANKAIEEELPEILLQTKTLQDTQKNLAETSQNLKKTQSQAEKNNQFLQKIESQQETIEAKLNELEELFLNSLPQASTGDFQEDLDDIQSRMEELRKDIQRQEQFSQKAEKYLEVEQKEQEVWDNLETINQELDELQASMQYLEKDLKNAEEREKDKEKIFNQEQLIKKYEDDRAKLTQGEPCPLCLSKDHPCHEHEYVPKVSETKKAWQEARRLLKKLEKEATTTQTNISNKNALVKELNAQKDQLAVANAKAQADLERIDLELYKTFFAHGKQLEPIRGKIQTVSEVLQSFEEVYRSLSKIKNNRDKLTLEQSKAKAETSKAKAEQEYLASQMLAFQNEQVRFEEIVEQTSVILNKKLQPFELEISADYIPILNKKKKHYQKAIEKLRDQSQALELNKNKNTSLQDNLHKAYQQLKEQSKSLQSLYQELEKVRQERHELFGEEKLEVAKTRFRKSLDRLQQHFENIKEQKSLTEKSLGIKGQKQKSQQEQYDARLAEQKERAEFLVAKAKENGFESVNALENAILSKTLVAQIEEQQARLQKSFTQKQQSLDDTIQKLEALKTKNLTDSPIEDLEEALSEQTDLQKNNAEQIGSLKEKITQNDQLKVRFAKSKEAIEAQEQEFKRWDMLRELIGSADGKKFRVYAQSLTLRKLVSLANQHLKRLNDRYFIIKSPEDVLELSILDRYHGNSSRSMTTLSGGESFLVSLALALGLSDLAGHKAQIQSLFIDEGFGTLDSSSLDLVLQALDNLQESGKTIGVISHVQELKERIHTQVQVVKVGEGVSKIRVVPTMVG